MKEMYYYQQNGEILEKYKIEFNIDELLILRSKIFNKCSYITHEEKEYSCHPSQIYNIGCIRNIKDLGETREKDLGSGSINKYHLYSYDLYNPPILVDLIDRLMDGDVQAIDNINNPAVSEKKFDFAQEINEESAKIDAISNLEIDQKIEALKSLKKTIQTVKLNENQVSAWEYYSQVQKLIKRELVATLNINDILKVTNFFEKDITVLGLDYVEKNDTKLVLKYISNKK